MKKRTRPHAARITAAVAPSLPASAANRTEPPPRPAPRANWSDPPGGNWVFAPGNWSNPPGGNWSNPPGGNYSDPPGWSYPPGAERQVGMGYHPDLPDCRDCVWDDFAKFVTSTEEATNERIKHLADRAKKSLPADYNLGDNPKHPLPPIEDQGRTNSCTSQAASGLVEYLYRWATGDYNDFSRMFIYYNARKLLGWHGDTGAYIRTTFKAMRLFGVPPETEWPFDLSALDTQPQPYHYSYANNFKTMSYARLDSYRDDPGKIRSRIKQTVHMGFPVEFGFPVYSCIQKLQNFVIPVPGSNDKLLGGHAVLAVGYHENVPYVDNQGQSQRGALIIRNSWGTGWGDQGYGFLPYWYIERGYASDFWTAYDRSWLKLAGFG